MSLNYDFSASAEHPRQAGASQIHGRYSSSSAASQRASWVSSLARRVCQLASELHYATLGRLIPPGFPTAWPSRTGPRTPTPPNSCSGRRPPHGINRQPAAGPPGDRSGRAAPARLGGLPRRAGRYLRPRRASAAGSRHPRRGRRSAGPRSSPQLPAPQPAQQEVGGALDQDPGVVAWSFGGAVFHQLPGSATGAPSTPSPARGDRRSCPGRPSAARRSPSISANSSGQATEPKASICLEHLVGPVDREVGGHRRHRAGRRAVRRRSGAPLSPGPSGGSRMPPSGPARTR